MIYHGSCFLVCSPHVRVLKCSWVETPGFGPWTLEPMDEAPVDFLFSLWRDGGEFLVMCMYTKTFWCLCLWDIKLWSFRTSVVCRDREEFLTKPHTILTMVNFTQLLMWYEVASAGFNTVVCVYKCHFNLIYNVIRILIYYLFMYFIWHLLIHKDSVLLYKFTW